MSSKRLIEFQHMHAGAETDSVIQTNAASRNNAANLTNLRSKLTLLSKNSY